MSKTNNPFPLPKVISSKTIFEESLVKLRRDELELPGRPPYTYYTLMTYPIAVAILATTTNGAYVLNEEYRHPTGKVLLGCPGGYVEEGEEISQAAARELLEETGYQAKHFQIMGNAYPYSGFSSQKTIFITAHDATCNAAPTPDACEVIRTRLFTPEELRHAIRQGIELDAVLCAALFFKECL